MRLLSGPFTTIVPVNPAEYLAAFATDDYLSKAVVTTEAAILPIWVGVDDAAADQFLLHLHENFTRDDGFMAVLYIILRNDTIYLCSEIGETRDVYRFDMEQNDLAEAAGLFNMFKGAREFFKTADERCKIVDIDAFYTGAHWSVERWWTHEDHNVIRYKRPADFFLQAFSFQDRCPPLPVIRRMGIRTATEISAKERLPKSNLRYLNENILDNNFQ